MRNHDKIITSRLHVDGALPGELSGRYVRIGPAPGRSAPDPPSGSGHQVDAISLRSGEADAFRSRHLASDVPVAGEDRHALVTDQALFSGGTTTIVEFGHRLLVLRHRAMPEELGPDLRSVGQVDLAGRGQGVGAYPTLDPISRELHLLASPGTSSAAHQVISDGALTRHTRLLDDLPSPVHHLAVTRDRLVLFGPCTTGVASRTAGGTERIHWFSTPPVDPQDVAAVHDDDGSVVVYVTGRSLERWTLDREGGPVRRHIIDAAPLRCARINAQLTGAPFRHLYTVGNGGATPPRGTQVVKHDLLTGRRTSHDFGQHRSPGEFIFVSDPRRIPREDGGWLLGVVHDSPAHNASLVVLDAADLEGPSVATVHLPGPVLDEYIGLWSTS